MRKFLIAEDDPLVATAYKKRFYEAGYAVEWASDGLEGSKMVAAVKPDVGLLDLLMPRLDGIEVLKHIRAQPELNPLPVVVFSNSNMTNLVENAWRAGADQGLIKASTTPAQLFNHVEAESTDEDALTRPSGHPLPSDGRGAGGEGWRGVLHLLAALLWLAGAVPARPAEEASGQLAAGRAGLRVGAASVDLEADDSMIIAGGITAGKATGQEGRLRTVAIVFALEPFGKFAIVANDILMITRQHLDPVVEEIGKRTGIPATHILINCTHTHHAPSTMVLHDYGLDETFTKRVQQGIRQAVEQANARLSRDPCTLHFQLGEEATVGQNSRQLMADGRIYWVGPRTNFVRATGPFDPELPVLAFRDSSAQLRAVLFNHSTHTIGTRQPGRRSPSFYGLAAQDLEREMGGTFCFLEGASGSTHNLNLTGEESTRRIEQAVAESLARAAPHPVTRLAALKRPFRFKVRQFDEAAEDAAVTAYCRKYTGASADTIIRVFRNMRSELAAHRGEERETWLQVLRIGDIAIAGVPGEYFTQLGLDIKNRSPFRYTYIAELANDWIGYLPNLEGHKLGGYQVWTGYHSYAEPGTGERIADEIVSMLRELNP